MNTSSKKVVGYEEALKTVRTLRWRADYLEEWGVTGADFLEEMKEELAQAEAVLSRKFSAKALSMKEMIENRVNRIKNYAFESIANQQTIH